MIGMVSEDWFEGHGAIIQSASDLSKFKELKPVAQDDPKIKRPYSITDDILAFRRCSRQYGFFHIWNYVPAQTTQLYFGVVIHEVLDRAHRQFRGLIEGKRAGMPSSEDIKEYFDTVTESLRARGIRPYSRKAEETAEGYLKRFNLHYGPTLYPRVIDTEHKLRADMKDFYLHGVVDVLASADNKPGELEIWDYKGSKRVENDSEDMRNYIFQMRVYSELYKRRNGKYPTRAILCFLGEDKLDEMILEVKFDPKSTDEAMKIFVDTVDKIEKRIASDDWSPPSEMPSKYTCGACDIRWDCPTAKANFPIRYP